MKFTLAILVLCFLSNVFADVQAVYSQKGDYAVVIAQGHGDAEALYNAMDVEVQTYGPDIFIKRLSYIQGDESVNFECDFIKGLELYTCGISMHASDFVTIDTKYDQIRFTLSEMESNFSDNFIVDEISGEIYSSSTGSLHIFRTEKDFVFSFN